MKTNKDISDMQDFKVFPSHASRAKLLEAALLEQEGMGAPQVGIRARGEVEGILMVRVVGESKGSSRALEAEGDSSDPSPVTTERHGDGCHDYPATTTPTLSQGRMPTVRPELMLTTC